MSLSKRVFRTEALLPSFAARLMPVERVDAEALKRQEVESDLDFRRETARLAGWEAGHKEGFATGELEGTSAGYQKGYEEAQAKFDEEHSGVISDFQASLEGLLADFQKEVEDWFSKAEERYAEVALEVTRRAVADEMKINHRAVLKIAHDVLSEVRSGTNVRIRVNPSDVTVVESHRQHLLDSLAGIGGLEVIGDRSVQGGVVIETVDGMVDARIETYVERFAESFLKEAA